MATLPPIYLSYAREDEAWSRALARALGQLGADVWTSENTLRAGDASEAAAAREIHARPVFVLVLSPAALTSASVAREARLAYEVERAQPWHYVIPLALAPVRP